ncbi:hypothetical protein HJC23_006345 [Cyclotella cryptica]|uniref:Uncharacterized protein n=1 Tax=Cyclotella cryptica TaxID=29204 RepID=A0ABD3Q3H4_9STRA|eukprot:CCRYP_008738-RA/>CCRYP_008738-RA protein AED:0.29 eAED:0.29 QI:492/1/1/1/0.66/0.5/4/473/643
MYKSTANLMDESFSQDFGCTSSAGVYRRRRRHLSVAFATAAVIAASPLCFAFSSSRFPCHSSRQSSVFLFHDEGSFLSADDSYAPRRTSRHALQMVSFLESETLTSAKPAARSRGREGRVTSGRKIELELPVESSFDFDYFVTTGRLEKSKVSASQPKIAKSNDSNVIPVAKAKPTLNKESKSITSEVDSVVLYSRINKANTPERTDAVVAKNNTSANKSAAPANCVTSALENEADTKSSVPSKSKSSTMPGFIKSDGLDESVSIKSMKMMTSRRKVSRIVRSKYSKLKRRQRNSEAMYKKSASVPDSLLNYAQEIHAISRVTPKQEIELGTKTQEAIRLQKMYEDLQTKYGREPTDDEWCAAAGKINMEALRETLIAGNEAKNQLVASNLRMVQRVVNLYIRNGLGSEYNAGDLMQDGTMALIRAAEKYEPERGFRFSTYAMYWIRSAVKRSQTMQSRIVNVPQRIHETYKRVTKMEAALRKELGRDPTKSELANSCEITVVQLDRCRRAMQQAAFSLDAEITNSKKPNSGGSSRKDTMYDIVASKVDETEYEKTQRLLMKEHLINTLRRYLTPHEVELLLLRYGLMDERALPKGMSGPLTIAEVSKLVGLKPDKVRRIIINSQKQLRHLMKEWEDFECEAT